MVCFCGIIGAGRDLFSTVQAFFPSDPAAAKEYEDLIRQDFETYISDVQDYFRCMESERARAFTEAQEVSQEYGLFVQQMAN